jgi:hypothetical protein
MGRAVDVSEEGRWPEPSTGADGAPTAGESREGVGDAQAAPQYGSSPQYGTSPTYGQPPLPAQPQGYAAPAGYPQAPGQGYPYPPYGYAPAPQRTSGMAIASLILGLVWIYWIGSILAVIFGHIALKETKRDPRVGGRALAIAGLVLGYIGLGILVIGLVGFAVSSSPTT